MYGIFTYSTFTIQKITLLRVIPPWHFKTATLTSPSLFLFQPTAQALQRQVPLFCPKLVLSSRDLSPTNYPAPAELQVSILWPDILADISSDILSGKSSDVLPDISSDILSENLSRTSSYILSGILSGISSDILSCVLSGDLLPSSNPKNGYFFPLLLFPGYNHGWPNGFL